MLIWVSVIEFLFLSSVVTFGTGISFLFKRGEIAATLFFGEFAQLFATTNGFTIPIETVLAVSLFFMAFCAPLLSLLLAECQSNPIPISCRQFFASEQTPARFKLNMPNHKLRAKRKLPDQRYQSGAVKLRRKLGRSSRIGGWILLALSAGLLLISYRYPNIVVEIDSVVSFAAALILFFKDAVHSVPLRVVDRILESSGLLNEQFADFLGATDYEYIPKGEKLADVKLVLLKSETKAEQTMIHSSPSQSTVIELVPVAQSLSQLFVREMGPVNHELASLVDAMQLVFSERLGLSTASRMEVDGERVTVDISKPLLKSPCTESKANSSDYSLKCIVCSLLASLVSFYSKKVVRIEACHQEDSGSTLTIDLVLKDIEESKSL